MQYVFSWLKRADRGFSRGIVPGALQASSKKLRSASPRLNQSEVLCEQPLGSEGLSFGFAIGSAEFSPTT
jgi:hypothetical protein